MRYCTNSSLSSISSFNVCGCVWYVYVFMSMIKSLHVEVNLLIFRLLPSRNVNTNNHFLLMRISKCLYAFMLWHYGIKMYNNTPKCYKRSALSVCPFILLSCYMFLCFSEYLSICLSLWIYVFLSVSQSLWRSDYLSVWLKDCMPVCPYISLSLSLPIYLPVFSFFSLTVC